MSSAKFAVVAFVLVVLSASAGSAQDRIPWQSDIGHAQQMAASRGQMVLLHFYGDSCPPCTWLEHHVFNRPEVIRAITTAYVPVKINCNERADVADRYRVESMPTDVILSPDGREVSRYNGAQAANKYIAYLDQSVANYRAGHTPQTSGGPGTATAPSAGQPPKFGADTAQTNPPRRAVGGEFIPSSSDNALSSGAPQRREADIRPAYANQPPASQFASQPNDKPSMSPTADRKGGANSTANADRYANPYSQSKSLSARGGDFIPSAFDAAPIDAKAASATGPLVVENPTIRQDAESGGSRPATSNAIVNNTYQPEASSSFQPPSTSGHSSTPAASKSMAPMLARELPPLMIDGYCPVTSLEQFDWRQGDIRFGAIHRGRTYLFAGDAERRKFLAAPDRYAPALAGYDVVRFIESGELVEGSRDFGSTYRDRIYLFGDEASLTKFEANAEAFAKQTERIERDSDPRAK